MRNGWTSTRQSLVALALVLFGANAWSQELESRATKSPWGDDDEIGALNMMTEASRAEVVRRAAGGMVYDLGVELFIGMPTCCAAAFGDPSYQYWMTHAPARNAAAELLSHSGDAIAMGTHTGTHIDTLSHFGLHGEIWNRVKADDAVSVQGWRKSGADKYPHIVARGVLIDVAAAKGVPHLPDSYAITVEDLRQAIELQRTELRPGDVVLIRTGLMHLWPDASRYRLEVQAGLSMSAARWLAEDRQALLVGSDNLGLESFPSSDPVKFAPVHAYLLAEKGVSFMEVLWLEELSRDRVYEFLFIASPLKLRGATGSPVRPLAIPLSRDD